MAKQLESIVALNNELTALRLDEDLLNGIPDWMTELHAEHSQRTAEIARLEENVEEARAIRRNADAAIADAQEKLKRYQDQINLVTTQREYGALLQEIDTTKGLITTAEEEGLAAMGQREEAEVALEQQREAFQDLDQRYATNLEKWESEKPSISQRIDQRRQSVETLREQVPPGLLSQFDRLRGRLGGDALAPILGIDPPKGPRIWHCGACNYQVRPQVVVDIRGAGNLKNCDSCRRILYFPPPEDLD